MNTAHTLDVRTHINSRPMSSYQWLLLALCFLIIATDGIDFAIMGFLASAITKEWAISRAAFGAVMSAALVGFAIGALLVGPLSDRFGRRKMLVGSVAWFGAFSLLCSLANDVYALSLLRFLTGLGLGAAMPPATTLLAEYVPEKLRSTLLAIMFTGFSLGSVLVGFSTAAILPDYGWRTVLVAGGLLPLLCLPLYIWLIPESARFMVLRKYPSARIVRTMRRVVGSKVANTAVFASLEPAVQVGAPVKVLLSPGFRNITLSLWVAYFMGLLVIYLLGGWMPTLIKDAGMPIEYAAGMIALFQLGGAAGALAVGYLMDRWTPDKVIACAYLAGAMFVLCLAAASVASSMFAAFVLLAGLCMMGAQTGLNAFAPSCYPTIVRATGVSWMQGVGRFGGIFGSFAGGLMLSMGWEFSAVVAILAVPAIAAAFAIVYSRFAPRLPVASA